MKEISLVICDDEKEVCHELQAMAERLSLELGLSIACRCCHSAEELLNENLEDCNILFLDIEMEGKNGFWAAEQIKASGKVSEAVCRYIQIFFILK